MTSLMEGVIAKGQLVPLLFSQHNAAASQAAVALNILEGETGADVIVLLAVTEYVIPWDFEVVGVAVTANAARTAGTLTVDPTINGTVTGLTAALNATDTQYANSRQPRGTDRGTRGQRVGCKVTTDAAWAPVTADLVVTVWILTFLEQV